MYFKVDFIKKYSLVLHMSIGTFISVDWTCHDSFDKFVRVSLCGYTYIHAHTPIVDIRSEQTRMVRKRVNRVDFCI